MFKIIATLLILIIVIYFQVKQVLKGVNQNIIRSIVFYSLMDIIIFAFILNVFFVWSSDDLELVTGENKVIVTFPNKYYEDNNTYFCRYLDNTYYGVIISVSYIDNMRHLELADSVFIGKGYKRNKNIQEGSFLYYNNTKTKKMAKVKFIYSGNYVILLMLESDQTSQFSSNNSSLFFSPKIIKLHDNKY